jgi:purine-binding chemotaxis protein CheW
MSQYLVFSLDGLLYAVSLSAASRVIRAVEITPLPKAPPIVLGVINLGGRIIPIVNIRKRFGLPERELELTDQLIVARASRSNTNADEGRLLGLAVDETVGVRDLSFQETTAAEMIVPGLDHLEGVAKTDQGLVLIHDLDTFLSLGEERALGALLPEGKG